MAHAALPSPEDGIARSERASKAESSSDDGSSHGTIASLDPLTSIAVHTSGGLLHSESAYSSTLFPQPGSVIVGDTDAGNNVSGLASSSFIEPEPSGPEPGEEGTAGVREDFVGVDLASRYDLDPQSVRQTANPHHRDLLRVARLIDEELVNRNRLKQEQHRLNYHRGWLLHSAEALAKDLKAQSINSNVVSDTKLSIKKGAHGVPSNDIDPAVSFGATGSKSALKSDSSGRESTNSGRLPSSADMGSETTTGGRIADFFENFFETQEQERIVAALTDVLGSLDHRLRNELQDLRGRLKSDGSDQIGDGLEGGSYSFSDTRSRSRSGASTPPLVRDYFDKEGDVGIYKERLVELVDTHEEGLIEREFLRDRGDDVFVSDQKYMAIYLERQDQIQEDLSRAEKHMDSLRQACEEAGHNIELHRRGETRPVYPFSSPESSTRSRAEEKTSRMRQIRRPPFTAVNNSLEPTGTSRVDEWRQKVAAESLGENGVAPSHDEFIYPDSEPIENQEPPTAGL